MNTQGMEIPLGLSLLAMSWHAWVRGRTNLAGLLCGVLLWVRIDFVFWVLILASVAGASGIKHALRIAGIAAVVYLPWVLFAIFYFGSAIPFTITAKWVAYSQFNRTPYSAHLQAIFVYLSPFLIEGGFCFFWAFMVFGIAAWGMWINRFSPQKAFIIFGMFIVFEITRLTVTRVTFFNRYLVPIYWATMILFGVGLGTLWERIKTTGLPKLLFTISILMLLTIQTLTGVFHAWSVKEGQFVTNESSLKRMGLWLKYNTDPQSVVLLEPLGYVGYYSERKMLDVVGLVTPSVVELKRRRIGEGQYLSIFQPDYFIVHCDDAIQILPRSPARPDYQPAAMFDPLHFNEGLSDSPNLGRSSCYEIWAKEQ